MFLDDKMNVPNVISILYRIKVKDVYGRTFRLIQIRKQIFYVDPISILILIQEIN